MHPLDDRSFVTRLDPKGMLAFTEGFPDQVRRAWEIAQAAPLPKGSAKPDMVVLTGLGGSAAGGDFARALFEAQGSVPFSVNRDYQLPNYVGPGTLVFAVSYSGNTEETVSAYLDARRRGCPMVVCASGGKLAEMARQDGFPLIQVPGGQPPRTALGFLFVPGVAACEKMGLLPAQPWEAAIALLEACERDWGVSAEFTSNPAKQLAQELHGKVSVIYGLGSWQGLVANRWKGQINENAKNMTFANVFPELCHNEILGWAAADRQGVSAWATIVLEDGSESAKMKKRAEVVKRLTASVTTSYRVAAQGDSLLEKLLSLTYFGDYVSLYLAALNGVDPENIDAINVLKNELSSVP
ncbi:MAG: bifunctional phosphoglucose/phosphomannose isomerase [Fimbriimonadaceae bacterium]|nr:bifunctional phosphoglucose/phosphomannose isomerase [Fimbriimonadaceae bacterium]QYK58219.1 MAG: bifunctional phosphoglucose/phosphomannose isomerase [Fimbriimonadaceae bacterium]